MGATEPIVVQAAGVILDWSAMGRRVSVAARWAKLVAPAMVAWMVFAALACV